MSVVLYNKIRRGGFIPPGGGFIENYSKVKQIIHLFQS